MFNRAICILLSTALILGPSSAARADSLWDQFRNRVSVSGSKSYGLQLLSVSGSDEFFLNDNYQYSSRYRNETNLTITGNLLTGLSLTATLSNNRWNQNDQSMTLNYNRGNTQAALGDITASITGNELLSFTKRLKGITATHNFGFCSVTAIASKSKAATKNVTVRGNNTPGPYYLGATQIVQGSETVKIDETVIFQSDASGTANYRLDNMSGILTFRDGMIVASTSTISVSFETQGYNNVAGAVYGVRSDFPIGKNAGVGLTYLSQKASDRPAGSILIEETFDGNNDQSLPYELKYVPQKGMAMFVTVGAVVQQMDVRQQADPDFPITPPLQGDYAVNYARQYIIFNRPIPSLPKTIVVRYFTEQASSVSANRTVMGVDSNVKVSNALQISSQVARSTSDYTGKNPGGNAGSIRATGKFRKLNYSANLRSMDPSFAPLENAGFFRSERGGGLDLRYAFTDNLSCYNNLNKFNSPDIVTGLTQSTTVNNTGIEWKSVNFPQVKLSRTSLDTTGGASLKTSQLTNALKVSWDAQKYGATGEISRSSNDSLKMLNGSLVKAGSTVATSRLNLKYVPDQNLSLSADVAGSKIQSSNGRITDAKNYLLSANYIPVQTISLSASYRLSDSGGYYDQPIDGTSGTTNGVPGAINLDSYGVRSSTKSLAASWTPSSSFSFDMSLNYTSSQGENNTNTSVRGTDVGFSYSPIKIVSIRAHSSRQNGGFIGYSGGLSSRLGFLNVSVGPVKKYTLDLNYQRMLSSSIILGTDETDNLSSTSNMITVGGNLRRELRGGRFLFTDFQSSKATGYLSNNKLIMAFGVEYPLNQILGLKIDWRIIDYKDTQNDTNDYRANMLNAQIGARFK